MERREIPIAEPCPRAAAWDDMPGDARRRFCDDCDRHVHDLSAMTEGEARALVTSRHVCVRYTFDHRGRILHLPAIAAGAMLASHAVAAPMIPPAGAPTIEDPAIEAPAGEAGEARSQWLPWLAARLPRTPLHLPRRLARALLDRSAPPTIAEPIPQPFPQTTGGVPPDPPEPPPPRVLGGVPRKSPDLRPVVVRDLTGRGYASLESSCCGRVPFHDGRASISVGEVGYIELIGTPGSKTLVRAGAAVVCTEIDAVVTCRTE